MTINATAAWLLALYIAVAEEQGAELQRSRRHHQNDIMKEYLSRGTFIFPPAPSLGLTVDTIVYTAANMPRWNPVNVCPYHLQEAGATPVQELAYGSSIAIAILDAVRGSGQVAAEDMRTVCGAISFFMDSSIRFVEEICKVAGVHRDVGPHLRRALRRRGPEAAPVPVRLPGQLARPHRAAAREQRAADHPRDARGDDVA